jgi:hypothetical protein
MPQRVTRFSARLLLLALSAVTVHGAHASFRQDLPVVHVERAHHLDPAPDTTQRSSADVCLACQLARTPCGPIALELSALAVCVRGEILAHSDWPLGAFLSATRVPARAPPSLA